MVTIDKNAKGFEENHEAALIGGQIAAKSRHYFEKTTGRTVVQASNFLKLGEADSNDTPSV